MAVLTKGHRPGDFLITEAPGTISRDNSAVLLDGGAALPAGAVLLAGPGGYAPVATGAPAPGAFAVLYAPVANVGTAPAPISCVVINCMAELDGSLLDWGTAEPAAVLAALALCLAQGLKVRNFTPPSPG
jgi:hypothetical protein